MSAGAPYAMVAVVLAGGASRRFGSDKLAADLHGRTVLDHALDGLPTESRVIVVGPPRSVPREVGFVQEDPPGGGPAAGLVAGLVWVLDPEHGPTPDVIVTLPGDAPAGGRAAVRLARTVVDSPAESAVGVDQSGRDQVLQLALRPAAARALVALAGPGSGHGQSVRRLISALDPAPRRIELTPDLLGDVDTTTDLDQLRNPGDA